MVPKEKTIEEIIEQSGNGLHSKVVGSLRGNDWSVLVSPYYNDNFTDKPRELDIIAKKEFPVHWFHERVGSLDVYLFIECKYILGKTVFWFDSKDMSRAVTRVSKDTFYDSTNTCIKDFHYLNTESVAKLFASEFGNEENGSINKAINQNLNALIYFRNRSDIIPTPHTFNCLISGRISYPFIVVNSFDNFYRVNMDDESKTHTPITKPFQLEVNYAYIDNQGARNEYFLIDVVSLEQLPEFLSKMEAIEIKTMQGKLAEDHKNTQEF